MSGISSIHRERAKKGDAEARGMVQRILMQSLHNLLEFFKRIGNFRAAQQIGKRIEEVKGGIDPDHGPDRDEE